MKKYKTIIADPPWKYQEIGIKHKHGQAKYQYPTMSYKDIAELNIKDVVHKDCVLLMWCTWPKLEEGLFVLNKWGFIYKSAFPWIKIKDLSRDLWGKLTVRVQWGIGSWSRGCSEVMLIGKRGNAKCPEYDFCGILSPNVVHSRKPKHIYDYAESFEGPYLELFARQEREGWDSFGNEIQNSITLNT